MNLAGQAATGPSYGLSLVASDTRAMLVHAHDGRVDHLNGNIMGSGQRVHEPAPDTCPSPAHKTVVAGGVWTKVAPRCCAMAGPLPASNRWPGRRTAGPSQLADIFGSSLCIGISGLVASAPRMSIRYPTATDLATVKQHPL